MKQVKTEVVKKADKKGSIQFVQATEKDRLPGIYIPRDILKDLDNADGEKPITIIFQVGDA